LQAAFDNGGYDARDMQRPADDRVGDLGQFVLQDATTQS